MKDETKEILDKLKSDDYYKKEYQKSVYYERDLKNLEDYITNLQEELETYKDTETYSKSFLYKENKERLKANQRLQQENERLHTRIKTIKRRRKAQTAKMRKYREEITKKQNSIEYYKSRIDKAIEYIKSKQYKWWDYTGQKYIEETMFEKDVNPLDLLNILKGGDE